MPYFYPLQKDPNVNKATLYIKTDNVRRVETEQHVATKDATVT